MFMTDTIAEISAASTANQTNLRLAMPPAVHARAQQIAVKRGPVLFGCFKIILLVPET
tara:strand:- start:591 stop:764 length:174 start_codon:yes stop_codon:yes gene_type:complete